MNSNLFRDSARTVDTALQERFASFSGDRNPMHMDTVAARRTQAGQPVVHGVHTLLWTLEELAQTGQLAGSIAQIQAKFLKWIYLGDLATMRLLDSEPDEPLRLKVAVQGLTVLTVEVLLGARQPRTQRPGTPSPQAPRAFALDLALTDLPGRSGEAYVASPAHAAELFPQLTALLGAATVAEIAACSYIVGMEAPGLHSMFSKLDLTLPDGAQSASRAALHYAVTDVDERFRKLRIAVEGRAVEGVLEAFGRVPPVRQASMNLVANYVQPGEFAGMHALVIGGSRGLGELTAKLIAAGGGAVTLTYALGRAEAEAVVAEIHASGGKAASFAYDVRLPPSDQLRALQSPPTHLYYFATGTIFRPKLGVLSAPMLAEFLQFYVQGFYDLCLALTDSGQQLSAFYPSTIFLDERPAGMTEYAMAKAAGEQLCADMNLYLPNVRVFAHRLPKLPTDQTAGILPERETDALEALLPAIRTIKA